MLWWRGESPSVEPLLLLRTQPDRRRLAIVSTAIPQDIFSQSESTSVAKGIVTHTFEYAWNDSRDHRPFDTMKRFTTQVPIESMPWDAVFEVRKVSMAKTAGQKSKLYSKYGKQLYVVAKNGGADPTANPSLRSMIEKSQAGPGAQVM